MDSSDGYLWLIYGWYGPEWWTRTSTSDKGYEPINCSLEQIEGMLRDAIVLDHYMYASADNESITDLGIVRLILYMRPTYTVHVIPYNYIQRVSYNYANITGTRQNVLYSVSSLDRG